jgi:outer membrane protein OmpA-like peptidoglycan-associated protein
LRAIVSAAGIADIPADFKTANWVYQGAFMKIALRPLLVALAALIVTSTAFGQTDTKGSKDYPGLTRLQGYYIDSYNELRFDSFTFRVTENGKEKKQVVEGHHYYFTYRYNTQRDPSKGAMPSALEVLRNYQNAVRAVGGKVLLEEGEGGDRGTTVRFTKGSNEVWIALHVVAWGAVYNMDIIEKQAMQQEVTLDAAGMASSIADSGSVAIYGINFDTASSVIKPESEPAIDEIAKLLTGNPALKVGIVGHTDMVGDATANMKLSMARAQAVITALVSKHGIAASRLIAFGAGPWAPVASNDTDEGRAKNRRVELVKITTK